MQQIRITKTPELAKVLAFFQRRYHLLSEADIIKMILSEKYAEETKDRLESRAKAKRAWKELKIEGAKLGDKMMREKGLDPKKVTEEEFYNIFLDDHKND